MKKGIDEKGINISLQSEEKRDSEVNGNKRENKESFKEEKI